MSNRHYNRLKNIKLETQLFDSRLRIAAFLLSLLFLILLVRLAVLQLHEYQTYSSLSQQNIVRIVPIAARRGLIYDRNYQLLTENVPTFSLDLIPDRVPNITQTLTDLSRFIPLSTQEKDAFNKHRKLHRRFEKVPLKLALSESEVAQFSANQYRFPGVVITARLRRHYLKGAEMASVLGFVGRINENDLKHVSTMAYADNTYIGKIGIEQHYEAVLHGQTGFDEAEIDASGRSVRSLKNKPPHSGNNLILTIDADLQKAAYDALADQEGAVVAIDPNNGDILAMVSRPSYNANSFVNGINPEDYHAMQRSPDKPLFNRALKGQFPLASTIKPFLALQGLNRGIISPKTTIEDTGSFQLPHTQHIYRDWKLDGHGRVNVTRAISESCDTFFYKLAIELGMQDIGHVLHQFGFGEPTGIDLNDEQIGLIPTPDWKWRTHQTRWFAGDTINSGIGQGYLLATPLQLAVATAALANRGEYIHPHLLLAQESMNGLIIAAPMQKTKTVLLEHPNAWNTVINAMQDVIRSPNGTGHRFGHDATYSIAAKTGTAQLYHVNRHRSQDSLPRQLRDHSLFIAFAPVKHPKIAIAVVVEHNPNAPTVARRVLDYYFTSRHPMDKLSI